MARDETQSCKLVCYLVGCSTIICGYRFDSRSFFVLYYTLLLWNIAIDDPVLDTTVDPQVQPPLCKAVGPKW